jgi:hypothetical protein
MLLPKSFISTIWVEDGQESDPEIQGFQPSTASRRYSSREVSGSVRGVRCWTRASISRQALGTMMEPEANQNIASRSHAASNLIERVHE